MTFTLKTTVWLTFDKEPEHLNQEDVQKFIIELLEQNDTAFFKPKSVYVGVVKPAPRIEAI
jgi:hypothetical protein